MLFDTDCDASVCVVWEFSCEGGQRADCILARLGKEWHYQVKCMKFKLICLFTEVLNVHILQFDMQLEVKFDGTGTKVVDLPEDHCSCKP